MTDLDLDIDHPEDAARLLEETEAVARVTRRRLQADGWQWLSVWAVICLGAGLSGFSEAVAPWYWVAAVPVGIAATAVISARIDARRGVRRAAWPYWTIGIGITVANFGAAAVLPEAVVVVLVWVVFGVGFAGFALLERQPVPAGFLAGLAGVTAGLGWAVQDTFALYPLLGFIYAAALGGIVAGLYARDRSEQLR